MTEDNVNILADFIASHPASQGGMEFLDELKEKSKVLYCTAGELRYHFTKAEEDKAVSVFFFLSLWEIFKRLLSIVRCDVTKFCLLYVLSYSTE